MFSPDREAHPAVTEIKFLQQPVFFMPGSESDDNCIHVLVDGDRAASIVLRASNRYTFRDLSHLAWSWHLTSNRSTEPLRSGCFELPNRHNVQDIVVILDAAISSVRELEQTRPTKGNRYFLNIRGYLVKNTTWAPAGHILVQQQLPLRFDFERSIPRQTANRPIAFKRLKVDSNDRLVSITRERDSEPFVVLNKATGGMLVYSPRGKNLLHKETAPNFTRAATDNDKGGLELTLDFMFPFKVDAVIASMWGLDEFSYYSHWKRVGLDQACPPRVSCSRMEVSKDENGEMVDIVALCTVLSFQKGIPLFKITVHYKVFGDTRVAISHQVVPQPVLRKITSIPRVGMNLQLDPSLARIQYFGRGPRENYPDRKAGSEMGVYETSPSKMSYLKYIVPSENGSRADCEWIAFRSEQGDGVCMLLKEDTTGETNFSCSASLYSNAELDAATHTCDLDRRREDGKDAIHVNLDHKLMGVGGDNSWFPVVYPEFRIKPTRGFSFVMWLLPLEKDDDPSIIAAEV